jgi:hypothetical protein
VVSVACGDWPGLIGLQTLDLLYQMTNPVNVEVIVDKQLFYLRSFCVAILLLASGIVVFVDRAYLVTHLCVVFV